MNNKTPTPFPMNVYLVNQAQLDAFIRKHSEEYVDERGVTWSVPSAWAYAQVCKARDKLLHGEPVAWMYTHDTLPSAVSLKRQKPEPGWTEIPLHE